MAITSKEINLRQLDKELGGQGLIANFNDSNNKLILTAENSTVTEANLQTAIDVHIAIDDKVIKEHERAALLERLGITEDEARLLLGGN